MSALDRAREELGVGEHASATAWALVAIAELLQAQTEPDVADESSLAPAGAGDPRSPEWTGRCMRCNARCQWGWCPVCQPAEFARLP